MGFHEICNFLPKKYGSSGKMRNCQNHYLKILIMKNLFKVKYLVLLTTIILTFACSTEDDDKNENLNDFSSSVAIINTHEVSQKDLSSLPITIKLVSFNSNYFLEEKYKIDGIEYNDNGLFNDQFAGDGIYTSVEKFNIKEFKSINTKSSDAFVSSNFIYIEEFKSWLKENYDTRKDEKSGLKPKLSAKVNVGCKMVTRPCPETTWYNTCYFSEDCTCVYLEDCELDVSIEVSVGG